MLLNFDWYFLFDSLVVFCLAYIREILDKILEVNEMFQQNAFPHHTGNVNTLAGLLSTSLFISLQVISFILA